MPRNTQNHKTSNRKIKLPSVNTAELNEKVTLPYNGSAVTEKSFSFSFSCFDRSHELFNLGDNNSDGVVSGKWFLDLLDCLKSVSNKTISDLKSSMHDLHPIDFDKTNTKAPNESGQLEYWQFRINKSKGRVIGFLIEGVFYIIWLDPHHNLTNSEGYGKIDKYQKPRSLFESQQEEIEHLKDEIEFLKTELTTAEELLNNR